jgi:polyphenol oxidase
MSEPVYYTQASFLQPEDPKVFHGFFTRRGGVSSAIYDGLNCGLGSSDDAVRVLQNRALVAQTAGIDAANLLSVHQVHGVDCVTVKEGWSPEARPKADAFVTDRAGYGLGILTADCAPVLFYGEKSDGAPVIAAAHAGWKGALGGVFASTLSAMEALGASRSGIKACVGPCIGRASYEVSVEFVDPFLEEHDESGRFFQSAQKAHHLMFDLSGYCAWRLFRDGLRSIALMDRDTYANEGHFYSYRRTTHRSEPDYGRQISVIAIK